ncbi:portal protein [Staphylococcus phage Alsa_1]|nr:portal protein [Staphylococcus phage Alsa_1]
MGDMLFDNAKDLDSMIKSYENTQVNKSIGKSDKTKTEPILGMIGQSPEFREKSNYTQSVRSIHEVLKRFGNNIIINAIVNTRSDQVALYCQPSRYSKKGMGFEVRLKDVTKTPGANEKKRLKELKIF